MQVLDVLAVLAQRYDNGQLTAVELGSLRRSLQDCCCLWSCNQQQWVGLQQEPYVSDDIKLAAAMAQVPHVYLLQLQVSQAGRPSSGATAVCVNCSGEYNWAEPQMPT